MSELNIDYEKLFREEARLVILKALADQANESLNSSMLELVLPTFGIRKERAWIHMEMKYLREMGAITISEAGSVMIGTLTDLGRRHLDRDAVIEGVKRPSRTGA